MKKSPNALRTIGEVAEEIGVATHVLRFWERKFKQISPQKRRGRRYYRPNDVKIITQIKALLYGQGYTIRGVQKFLSDDIPTELRLIANENNKNENKEKQFTKEELLELQNNLHRLKKKIEKAL